MSEPAQAVHVSMAADRGYEVVLGVSLLTLAEAFEGASTRCQVSVLGEGLDAKVHQMIERDLRGRIDVEWVEVDLARLEGARQTIGLSKAALFRILLPELLEERVRTIYLDADTVVLRPLVDLWEVDLGDRILAAVRDAGTPYAAGPLGTNWRALGLTSNADYFNSGVLVLPLDRWRQEGISEKALAILRQGQHQWGDQDALNVVAHHRWLELPRRWNVQTADAEERSMSWALWREDVEDAVSNPAVIHYTEPRKPWLGRIDHPFADAWNAALARSVWAGWTDPSRTAFARARGRVVRAGRVLAQG